MNAIKFSNNRLWYIDQTKLPACEHWRQCKTLKEGFSAIKSLKVRGAPLIGVFAAYCIAVSLKHFSSNKNKFFLELNEAVSYLKSSRPTAVNLFWALERMAKTALTNKSKSVFDVKRILIGEAKEIHKQDIMLSNGMADYGIKLIKNGDRILTHCNTGFLAASGCGTALSIIYKAHKMKMNIKVYIDETRPLLQGARLTAWELVKAKVPCELISDNMAAYLMQRGMIDKVFVGADRIASNGDTANKIGTYSLAVLCRYHNLPFYVVAPFSTFDLSLAGGNSIPIEQRNMDEVRTVLNKFYIAPKKIPANNPAFDVTPNGLITAIVCDRGIIRGPFKKNIKKLLGLNK
ncbi:MAG: S-methyl-5-thioribose-1-phosphate isomerase [Candidatus Omnitrophota bacterium]